MAEPSPTIPMLSAQPPSVDFLENRIPKIPKDLTKSSIRYNSTSQQFVSSPVIDKSRYDLRRQAGPTASQASRISLRGSSFIEKRPFEMATAEGTETENVWNNVLVAALPLLQKTVEPRIGNQEFSIRNDQSWDNIYIKLENARSNYLNEASNIQKTARWVADNVTPAATLVKVAQGVAPSNPYSTPILGAIQLISNAFQVSADIRTEALGAFDNLLPVLSEAELFLSTFPDIEDVNDAAVDLAVAILRAIEEAIAFFNGSWSRKVAKTVFNGPEYLKALQKTFRSIEGKSNALRKQVQNFHIVNEQRFMRRTEIRMEYMNQMLHLLNEHVAEKERELEFERQKIKRENMLLRVENNRLRSRSPSPNNDPGMRQQDEGSEAYLDQLELSNLLTMGNNDADMAFITERRSSIPNREVLHAQQIVNHAKFHKWITSARSAKLLILWDRRPPKTIAGITPLSIFFASLVPMLRDHSHFILVTWFCGLHTGSGNSDAWAILGGFIDQLFHQYPFNMENLGYEDVDKSHLWHHDPNELFSLFCWLIRELPRHITLVFLIDEVYIYERDELTEGLFVFEELLSLSSDPNLTTVKLLFTSTRRTEYLRPEFQQEDFVINMEGLPRQTGMPSEGRMLRQMKQGRNEGNLI